MIKTGIIPEDFPALGLYEGDMLRFHPVEGEFALPERQPVIVRNIYNGKLALGYVEGPHLYLATECIRNYRDWGAEVVAIVTDHQQTLPEPKF